MDLTSHIRLLWVPRPLKWAIGFLLAGSLVLNLYIAYRGLVGHEPAWVEAGANLLGIVLPASILAALAAFSESGVRALRRKTTEVLLRDLPEEMRRVTEQVVAFYPVTRASRPSPSDAASLARVSVNLVRDRFLCDYEILAPAMGASRRAVVRVEINVKKANFNLSIPLDLLTRALVSSGKTPTGAEIDDAFLNEASRFVLESFKHTIAGAASDSENGIYRYRFNERLLVRTLEARTYLCLVGSCLLPRDFLWDSAERLFFAQDLMLMVRAFMTEQPELFELLGEPSRLQQ